LEDASIDNPLDGFYFIGISILTWRRGSSKEGRMSRRRLLLIASISLFIALASMLWRILVASPPSSITKPIRPMMSSSTYPLVNGIVNTNMDEREEVIIVGSGLAGLSAASTLVEKGVRVHMLERFPKPGGNSLKASSGINGAPTKYQPAGSKADENFYSDTVKSAGSVFDIHGAGGEVNKKWIKKRDDLVRTLTNDSKDAIRWLTEEKGVDLSVVTQLGGHSFPRTHRGKGQTPPGASLVFTLLGKLKESDLFQLETECVVEKVLKNERGVQGVECICQPRTAGGDPEKKTIYGPTIFASGGFAGDSGKEGMLAQYRPDLVGFPSTNVPRPGSQRLLTDVGAQLLDMEQVQIHPTSFVDPADVSNPIKFLAAELLRGEGGILLHKGHRFLNEMETRKSVTDAITKLEIEKNEASTRNGIIQWDVQLVLDEGVYENASAHIGFYIFKGLMRKTTIAELCAIHPATLESIKAYSTYASGLGLDPLGRQYFGHWKLVDPQPQSTVYVGRITPAVHFTMGGVVIGIDAEVLNSEGDTIDGLWAAGEVSGGVHGENRLGGSSLLECVVFGRRAGLSAAKRVLSQEMN
jgi:FAD-dependent fumarate reductase